MKGSEFKRIREQLELTQNELAKVLCLSTFQAVSNIETGFRKPGKLIAVLMWTLSELPERRAKDLMQLITSIAEREIKVGGRKS